jgi:hypothetical protein
MLAALRAAPAPLLFAPFRKSRLFRSARMG